MSVRKFRGVSNTTFFEHSQEWQPSQVRKLTYFDVRKWRTPALAGARDFAETQLKTSSKGGAKDRSF